MTENSQYFNFDVKGLEVRPFTAQQVERFIYQWYLALEPLAYHLMAEGKRDITLDEVGGVIAEALATGSKAGKPSLSRSKKG